MVFSIKILVVLLNTNCKPWYSVTNTKCQPNVYLSFLVKSLGDYRYTLLQLPSLTKWFLIQNSIIHNISSQVVHKRKQGFGQRRNSSTVHDNTCSLIHNKCHPKSHHSDINYHIILNSMFTVLMLFWVKNNSLSKTITSNV